MNDDYLRLTVSYRLSRTGQLDALRQGELANEVVSFTLEPGDQYWGRAIDLEPSIDSPNRAVLLLGLDRAVVFDNDAPTAIPMDGPDEATIWRTPRAALEVVGDQVPWDQYRALGDALATEEAERRSQQLLLAAAEADLEKLREERRRWICGAFLVACEASAFKPFESAVEAYFGLVDEGFVTPAASLEDLAGAGSVGKLTHRLDTLRIMGAHPFTDDELDEIMDLYVESCATAYRAVERVRQLEERAQERREAMSWVAHFGSARLKKGLRLGLLPQMLGAYRDERLRAERPGWEWLDRSDWKIRPVVNPSETVLDILAEAREFDADAGIHWLEGSYYRGPAIVARFLGRDIAKGIEPLMTEAF